MNFKTFINYLKISPYLVYSYFNWINKYAKHPEKKSIEFRYGKFKKLVNHCMKSLNPDIVGINVEAMNNHQGTYLGVSNHRHYMDPFYLAYFSDKPISFVAKKEVAKIPFVGKVFKAIDGYFIDREDLMGQVRLFKEVSNRIKKGDLSYYIFPEGTRMKNKDSLKTLPYKDGSLKPAYWAEVDIIYVAHLGTDKALLNVEKGHKANPITFKFFSPLKYHDIKDKKTTEIMPMIEKDTNKALVELNELNNKRSLKK